MFPLRMGREPLPSGSGARTFGQSTRSPCAATRSFADCLPGLPLSLQPVEISLLSYWAKCDPVVCVTCEVRYAYHAPDGGGAPSASIRRHVGFDVRCPWTHCPAGIVKFSVPPLVVPALGVAVWALTPKFTQKSMNGTLGQGYRSRPPPTRKPPVP